MNHNSISMSFNQDKICLVQVTDTHLFAGSNEELLGVNTSNSFRAVVDDIEKKQLNINALIMTGDVSQDHSLKSYQRFAREIKRLQAPCFWLPGNHDDQSQMYSKLDSTQLHPHRHVVLSDHWQLILLDSQVYGVPHGKLSAEQLDFLDQTLIGQKNHHTLVLLHHHPLAVRSQWLDNHCLKNSDEFWHVLSKHPHVKGVFCGHIHQALNESYLNIPIWGTPSTSIQFKPDSNHFALDRASPGWREIILHRDGQVSTKVYRLSGDEFFPDFSSLGY